jgi:hydrogenase large subunit
MSAPTLSDITRSIAILEYWKTEWLEKEWLGCSLERWMQIKTWNDVLEWVNENEAQYNSDCGFFIRYALEVGLDQYGAGHGNFLSTGTYFDPTLYADPTIEGRNAALISRSGIYAAGGFHEFDQGRVREDHTHSFYKGTGALHPFEGVTDPIDPITGEAQGKYSWAKSPRYSVPGLGYVPLEVGPLARQVMAAQPNPAAHQDADPFILNVINEIGPSVLVRVLARVHELAKYYTLARTWLDEIDLHDKFYAKPTEHESGKGFGSTEAARGALSDWIVLENGKIENYQVITPTAWNVGPRDADSVVGPIEKAFIGTPVQNTADPVELGHVARSFDSCLVCTVHAYDGKTGKQLARFTVGGM